MTVSKEALNKTAEVGNLTEFLITVKNIGDIHLKDVFVKEGKHDGLNMFLIMIRQENGLLMV